MISWRKLAQSYLAVVVLAAALAPWLSPAGYEEQNRAAIAQPVSRAHPLGTDEYGRDRWARLLEPKNGS